jgi:tetratricopeptide (TPR) repeat protein
VGLAYYSVGDYPRAVECLRAIIRRLEGDQVHERFGWAGLPAVLSRAYLAGCLAEQGAFLEGICVAQEAVSIAEAADHHFSLGQALFNLGVLHVRLGELVRAVEILERCLDLNRLADVPAQLASTTSALGYAYALSGRVPEGIRLLEEGVAESVSRSIVARYSQWVAWSSEAQLLGGERDRAAALADRALALSRAHGMRGNEAYALRIRAEVASQQDPLHVDATVQLYGEALALAARLGMRPLEAQVRAGLGRLYRRAGRLAEARRELTAAASTFRELNMSRWASGVESELSDP